MSVTLLSMDEEVFVVQKEVAAQSATVKNMLDDIGGEDAHIPIANISGKNLAKIIDYCNYHHANPTPADADPRNGDISPWDQEFCKVDLATLFALILAANYLDIKGLLDVTTKTVANMIKGKTSDDIRTLFAIKNDFTPEEEAEQVALENEWCDER